jgi:hypothetical protein
MDTQDADNADIDARLEVLLRRYTAGEIMAKLDTLTAQRARKVKPSHPAAAASEPHDPAASSPAAAR